VVISIIFYYFFYQKVHRLCFKIDCQYWEFST